MKKLQFFFYFLIIPEILFSQKSEVTNAFLSMNNNEFDIAKQEIDRAAIHEKTKDDPKTWYFRGKIYHSLFTSKAIKFASIQDGSGEIALESFSKAKSLSKPGDEYYEMSSQDLRVLFGDAFSKAIFQINTGDSLQQKLDTVQSKMCFAKSFNNFVLANRISPNDTMSLQNAFICATRLKDYNKAVEIFGQLEGKTAPDPKLITTIVSLANLSGEKSDASITWIRKGIEKFPKDINFRHLELDWFSANDKLNEAKTRLEETIRLDSSNAGLYSILGNIYDQEASDVKRMQKDRDLSKAQAINSYRKALKLDPTNMVSNYNLGVYYFNKGAEILAKIESLNMNDYTKKGKVLESEADKEFTNALPYFENCYKKDLSDQSIRKPLKKIYVRLKRQADAEKIPD